MDTISIALGLPELEEDIDCDRLFKLYGMSDYDKEISREETLKRNAEIVTCDRCGVQGNRPNMMRWHFENCKTILRNCEHCGDIIPRQGTKEIHYKVKKYCGRSCYMASKKGKLAIDMTDDVKNKLSIIAKNRSEETRKLIGENSAKARIGKKRPPYKKKNNE